MRWFERPACAVLLGLFAGCASAGQPGTEADAARFEREVGTGSGTDVMVKSAKVIRQYLFEVKEQTDPPNIYIETHWRDRTPFPDEQALGIQGAQTRLIVRARQRGTTPLGEVYAVNLAIENRVRIMGTDGWSEASATREYRDWANRIADDFRRELNVGVRRFGWYRVPYSRDGSTSRGATS